ncbi:MAG: hypothetical protein JSS14_08415 [Proteobacteria bacterium]|nr:hypothetical protein [Pseudomonadota bacterium]
MTNHRSLTVAATMAASILLATSASIAHAQTPESNYAAIDRDVRSLKTAYLRCEQAANERLLDLGEAATCSVIYEELLKIGFGGEFKRLLAWWDDLRVAEPREEPIDAH